MTPVLCFLEVGIELALPLYADVHYISMTPSHIPYRYVATRIGSWRQKGKQTIRNMLAKMGMPLEQCNQKYTSMELESRGRLEDQMVEYSDDYKLEQIIFPSFISQASYRLQYSASDVVFSTVGLLEASNI